MSDLPIATKSRSFQKALWGPAFVASFSFGSLSSFLGSTDDE